MDHAQGIPEGVMWVVRKCSTGMVADALGMSGIKGLISGIRSARGFEDLKIIGPVATVLLSPPRLDSPKLNNYQAV